MSTPIRDLPVAQLRGAVLVLELLRADLADAATGAGRATPRGVAFLDVVGVIDQRLEVVRTVLRDRRST
jgi:hypothetical protein